MLLFKSTVHAWLEVQQFGESEEISLDWDVSNTISQGRDAFIGSSLRCDSALHATNPPNPVHIKAQWSCSLSVAKLHCITKHNTVSLAYNQKLEHKLDRPKNLCSIEYGLLKFSAYDSR
jgi:hypothetical protein